MCHHVNRGNTCSCGQDCVFRRYSTPPTKGDTKAMELGAPAKMPDGAAGSGAAAEAPKKQMISFLGAGPSNSKEAGVVVELIHRYDDEPPAIRRRSSDRAVDG